VFNALRVEAKYFQNVKFERCSFTNAVPSASKAALEIIEFFASVTIDHCQFTNNQCVVLSFSPFPPNLHDA
jgi:hypothetical protein